jgi:hypothetical protein
VIDLLPRCRCAASPGRGPMLYAANPVAVKAYVPRKLMFALARFLRAGCIVRGGMMNLVLHIYKHTLNVLVANWWPNNYHYW